MDVRDLAQEAIPVVIRATNVKFHVTGLVVICRQHNDVIERYAHGIMTFQGYLGKHSKPWLWTHKGPWLGTFAEGPSGGLRSATRIDATHHPLRADRQAKAQQEKEERKEGILNFQRT